MVDVRQRINAIEQRQVGMSHDLQRFVDLVWSHRKNNVTGTYSAKNVKAYRLYTRSHKTPGIGSADMIQFFQTLRTFPQVPEIQCSVTNPKDSLGKYLRNYFNAKRAASGFAELAATDFQDLCDEVQTEPQLCKALSRTFYHFRRFRGKAMERIYLHTKPREAANVMGHVLRQMVRRPNAHPGLSNAKTSAPSSSARYDSIVIYLQNTQALDAALTEIANYQQAGNRHRFEHGSSRTTRVINSHGGIELVGVSTGAEPPVKIIPHNDDLVLHPGGSSFGSYRSLLIDFALKNTLAKNEDKPQFVLRVVNYFRAAGIDPKAPEGHSNSAELHYLARKTLQQLKSGQEPTHKIG